MIRIQLGELPAGRMALEGADLAPGTQATPTQLRQRPARPRDPLPPEIENYASHQTFLFGHREHVLQICDLLARGLQEVRHG